jgi:hypothetical protein
MMNPRLTPLAALVLALGCVGPDDTPQTQAVVEAASVPPMEMYRADAEQVPSGRVFHDSNARSFFPVAVFNPNGFHTGYVDDFVSRSGFGGGRFGEPRRSQFDGSGQFGAPSRGSHDGSDALKYQVRTDTFTQDNGTALEQHERVWLLQDRQLVGLVVAETPAVYLITPKNQYDLMKPKFDGATAPKRLLDAFETEALAKLRGGDEVALRADDTDMRMLGAIRARKDCLSCHRVEVGTLLGAFSYTLKAQSEETPAEHKLADTAGLTDRERAAVRAIEAVGGKVIRTPGGAVTEVKMTFARNQIALGGQFNTRLQLRDSALSHLLASDTSD